MMVGVGVGRSALFAVDVRRPYPPPIDLACRTEQVVMT
jgi:hypothetical protein